MKESRRNDFSTAANHTGSGEKPKKEPRRRALARVRRTRREAVHLRAKTGAANPSATQAKIGTGPEATGKNPGAAEKQTHDARRRTSGEDGTGEKETRRGGAEP
jgi:hypothetical protein